MNKYFQLKTAIPGIQWPAITSAPGALSLSLLRQLEQSQWMPAEALRKQQFRQLDVLLKHAYENSSYYRKQLRGSGYDVNKPLNDNLWSIIPILSRSALQQNPDEIRCSSYPQNHGRLAEFSSSGSTGKPVKVYRTMLTAGFNDALNLRDHLWCRHDFSGRLALIRYVKARDGGQYPDGSHQQGWGHGVNLIFKAGDSWLLRIDTPVSQQVEWLTRVDPDYILTYPTNIIALAKEFEKQNKKPKKLRQISTISESLSESTKNYCEDFFSVPVADMYSCQEIGMLASRCPDHPSNYHVHSEHVMMEILNDENQPCKPGVSGRVVLTDLHNFSMPLIRYEVGDYVEAGDECSCGRGLPVINKILGRERNLLTLPSGEQMWPIFGTLEFNEITGKNIRQVQFIQADLNNLELKLVMDGSLNAEQVDKLTKLIHDNLGFPFNIEITYCDDIPRSKSGKFEDFVSLL